MPAVTCRRCGGETNSAASDYDYVQKTAAQCYARLEGETWVKGCAYDETDPLTRRMVDAIIGKSFSNQLPPPEEGDEE